MKLLSQKGVSLIQVMVGMGIATGLGIMLMKQQDMAGKVQTKANINQMVNSIASRMQSAVSNRAICSVALEGKGVGDQVDRILDAEINPLYPVESNREFLPKSQVLFEPHLYPGDVELEKMEIVSIEDKGTETFNDYLQVTFDTDPRDVKKAGSRFIAKNFILQGVKDSNGKYLSCYSEHTDILNNAIKQACEDMGAQWDDNSEPKCQLKNIPQCIVTEEACAGVFSVKKDSYSIAIKNMGIVTCTQHYDKRTLCPGQGEFTRTCTCQGNACPCDTGSVNCYKRDWMSCNYEILKSVNRCCQKGGGSSGSTTGGNAGGSSAGGSGGSTGGSGGGGGGQDSGPKDGRPDRPTEYLEERVN